MQKLVKSIVSVRFLCFFAAVTFLLGGAGDITIAQEASPSEVENMVVPSNAKSSLSLIDTSDPRATLFSFIRLSSELEAAIFAYQKSQSPADFVRLDQLLLQFRHLFDIRSLPRALRSSILRDSASYLLDTMGRLDLPAIESVPDTKGVHHGATAVP